MEEHPDKYRTRTLDPRYLAVMAQRALEHEEPYWSVRNSRLEPRFQGEKGSFHYSFTSTLPIFENDPEQSIKTYIESTLAERSGEVLAIELGGLGSALFAGFSEGFIKESRAISLVDNRHFYEDIDPTADSARGHDVIAGDVVLGSTKQAVSDWLGDRKLDLILERMRGGLALLPDDSRVLLPDLDFWYKHLSVGGIMFAEVPPAFEPYVPDWLNLAQESGLSVSLGAMPHYDVDANSKVSVLRILKSEGSPETFPFLES